MRNLKLILQSIIATAFITFIFTASSCSNSKDNAGSKTSSESSATVKIGYVNMDTLTESYHYYTDLKTKLITKQQKISAELDSRYKGIQLKGANLQKKVQDRMMTPGTAQKQQQKLLVAQQKLMEDKQKYEAELYREEQQMMLNILDSIKNYLKIYNKDKKFSIILANDTLGRTILLAEKQMDITKDILLGINDRYTTAKAAASAEKNK